MSVEITSPVPAVRVGDRLPEHVQGPIGRVTLALYAGASNDHNPLHIDSDFARSAGLPDVIAHGMLSMAYLGQLLTRWLPQHRLHSWSVRFMAVTPLHAKVHCHGEVVEVFEEDGRRFARLAIRARTDAGVQTLAGTAVVDLD